MTAAQPGSAASASWRGVAAEKADDVSAGLAALLRERSRLLLGDLLRPHRRAVIMTVTLIVVASLAVLAGPWLVGIAIDNGLPPLLNHSDPLPLLGIAAAFAVAVATQAVTTRMFVTMTGRIGQAVVLELRRRLFAHFLVLDAAFHEDYTSGRVISRQTSDVEAISDLFEEGLDSLITAILTLLLVGTGMLLLDWRLGLVVLAGFVPLTWLTVWFRSASARAYRRTREAIALVIVHFVETFGGIRAVQAFRREERNAEIFSGLGQDYADASAHASRLIAIYGPSISLVGNIITAVILGYGGLLAIEGNLKVGVLATFLLYLQRFFDPLQDVSQFYNIFQSAASGLEKISGVLEQDASVPEPAARRSWRVVTLARPGARCGSIRSPSATGTTWYCRGWTWRSRPARRWPSSARPVRARPRSPACSAGSTTRAPAASRWTEWTCANSPTPCCAPRSSSSPRRTSCSMDRSTTTSGSAARMPRLPTSSRRPR